MQQIDSINNKITKLDVHFRKTNESFSEKERLFSRAIKLNEEVGELCEAVLYENDNNQRKKEKEIDLDSELVDVIICTLLLAHNRKKDVWIEIDKKLDKQLNRFNL
ncbi:hypothetical protein H6784_03750 [Candidatus Nomurabacteria bacterium]|nr:hypothetical protein [Candidatus Kaiserbacteria bacterium]MCB9814503.1 hypothetical protein [Candidatus Nomurabacteria bacterium]